MDLVYILTWKSVLLVIDKSLIEKVELCPPFMLHWKRLAHWKSILLLEKVIQFAPEYTCPHVQRQYLS